MEKTVDTLEAMFQKAESDINYLSRKIECEFEQKDQGNKVNPVKMLQKITDIKKEYASLVKEAAAIQEAQKEAAEFFKTQLMTACQLLQKIQEQSGKEDGERPEEIEKLEEILGIKLPGGFRDGPSNAGTDNNQSEQATPDIDDHTFTLTPTSSPDCASVESPVSPASRRLNTDEFIELTQKEFESVSESVRGRLKLMDVNMVYRILWRHFKDEQNSEPLNPSQMYKMGLKVSGTTGEAKLKVLKTLKLCTISKNKEVKLV